MVYSINKQCECHYIEIKCSSCTQNIKCIGNINSFFYFVKIRSSDIARRIVYYCSEQHIYVYFVFVERIKLELFFWKNKQQFFFGSKYSRLLITLFTTFFNILFMHCKLSYAMPLIPYFHMQNSFPFRLLFLLQNFPFFISFFDLEISQLNTK